MSALQREDFMLNLNFYCAFPRLQQKPGIESMIIGTLGGLFHLVQWKVHGGRWVSSVLTACFIFYVTQMCEAVKHIYEWTTDKTSSLFINPLDSKDNYSATSNNTKLVHWPLIGGLLHLVQRGGAWAGCGPAQSPPRFLAVPNVLPSMASVSITVLLYDGPLLWGFNVAIKVLKV